MAAQKGICTERSKPKLSIKSPISTCPKIGITAVCTPPNLGEISTLAVSPTVPSTPPSHAHQGTADKVTLSNQSGLPNPSDKPTRKISPTKNETNEVKNAKPKCQRSRALTADRQCTHLPIIQ
ncbi:hypothetical protein AAHK14_07365 [Moraxella sp. K1664]|uniref:hypothetical protein n=1 Tax=Moraxella sp. K1664 TaxID=2780077 RepID=UPI001C12A02D|nr:MULTISPECIES: hypothetical protein [Moraxella]MDH9218680.1 hypothetical protein [Moraxella lacunata]